MTRHSIQTDMLELVTDTHRTDDGQLAIGDALEAGPENVGTWTRCPACRTSGHPHQPDGDECRMIQAERAEKMAE